MHKVELMCHINTKTASRLLTFLNPRRVYHRAEIEFADRLPAKGGAVIVSNHGRLDFDFFILIGLILRHRRRLARLMADHLWFRLSSTRCLMHLIGAVDGNRRNAMDLLGKGELILTYPGGVREIMGSQFGHEHINWQGRTGFANVAVSAGVPVIPVVSVGVNNGFIFLTKGRLLGRFLFQGLLRLGRGYEGYRDPLVLGLVPLPLPLSMAVHFPLPCKVRYIIGEPIYTSGDLQDIGGQEAEKELARRVACSMHKLIGQYGRARKIT